MVQGSVLAITDNVVVLLDEVLNAVRMVKKEVVQDFNPLIINQGASLSTFLSLPFSESVTVNIYAFILSPIPCLFVTLYITFTSHI